MKNCAGKQKLKEIISTKLALQEMLKGLLIIIIIIRRRRRRRRRRRKKKKEEGGGGGGGEKRNTVKNIKRQ